MVLQTQLFAAGKYKEQLDEDSHQEHPPLALVTSLPFSHSVINHLFKVKHSFVGNCTGVPLTEEVEEINITHLVLRSSA